MTQNPDSEFRPSVFRRVTSHLHMNINLHLKGSRFTLDVNLVEENFTFSTYIFFNSVYMNKRINH